jgi:hypothetical protein
MLTLRFLVISFLLTIVPETGGSKTHSNMKKIFLLMIAGSLLIFSGCRKTGPQGPQGIPGPAGIDGNANVIGTAPFTVYGNTWTLANGSYSATFTDPDITPDIVDKGVVEIFKSYGTNRWTNLPDINGITSTVFDFYDGGFTIYVQNSDGSTPANPGTQIFRTVIISASQKQANPKTNWKNYNEAVAAINNVTHTVAPAAGQ